ncbi:hypothetical protein MTR_0009s0490 [Medicago truncatula]|uniref:Uncharacterized protein n=1 Tax=Medicago truncatula TaxID=3880 RepID=A0A072TVH8_MEDTR|nr:hypothetical protein MTR_0009s0490 [Medicago truncatula]
MEGEHESRRRCCLHQHRCKIEEFRRDVTFTGAGAKLRNLWGKNGRISKFRDEKSNDL